MSVDQLSEDAPLLPTVSTASPKAQSEPSYHALFGISCVATSALCFSLMSTFIKYMTFTFSSMEAIFWRSIGAFVCNFIVVVLTGQSLYVAPEYRRTLVLRCIAGFACMGFAFYAMSQMVLADASVIVFTSPVMTFFFGAFVLHENIDPISFVSAVVAFGGLICVVRPGFLFGYDHPTAAADGSWIAVGSGLLGALSQVCVFLTVRQLQGLNLFAIVHYFTLSSIVFALLWIAIVQQTFYVPSSFLLWRAIIGTGLFTFGGQMFLTKGFQLEKAGIASVMRYLDVVFVIMSTLIKYQTYTMSSMEAIFWRSTGAFVFNFVSVLYLRKSLYVAPSKRKILALRCLAGFSSIGFAFYAVSQMVLADASVIILTSPVMTFFFGACLLHERIDLVSLLSAVFAFGGLVFVVRPGFLFGYDQPSERSSPASSWVAVGAALLGALGQVFVFITVRQLQGVHALVIVHYFMLSSAIVALLWVTINQDFVVPSAFEEWRAIVGCGLFTFVGQMFLTKGFQLEKAGIASVMRYLDVVFVFIWDSTILHEHINHYSVVGAVIILTSAIAIAVRKMKHHA
ncbi:hypothetical protein BBO99_00002386 [Phytophthora kernoviae]|uniref:EamA domain-containing protein n=1 Tax=Phytophthora kernoviae TaxID=325452 RepID=A0A3R7FXF2_9STRA|nr:hypothetical protein JM16_000635 [Phytophthora kernoviae]RLN02102.1 hypothetical protein BBI17_002211 [Phytophthora kernoviae]RLN83126.1 hypothetical protein BBO99_00002386 [Phytophthora kernoviae]